jgi:hypothetical protein
MKILKIVEIIFVPSGLSQKSDIFFKFRLFYKPLPEQRFRHFFQGDILAMQQVYFIVQTAENGRNGALFFQCRNFKI